MFQAPLQAQDLAPQGLDNVAPGIVSGTAHGEATLDRFRLRLDHRIDSAPLETGLGLGIGVFGVGVTVPISQPEILQTSSS